MKYIIKHNIPDLPCNGSWVHFNKKSALDKFKEIEAECMDKGYTIKSFLRKDKNKPLRATLQVEVDNFTYYAELFAQ